MILSKLILTPFMILAIFYPIASEETVICHSWVGKVVSFQGRVEEQRFQTLGWQPVQVNAYYCPGDRIRTLDAGQARILLYDNTSLQLEAWTTITFLKIKQTQKPWYNPFKKLIQYLQGKPLQPKDDTLFINAAFLGLCWRRCFNYLKRTVPL
jgi:hypothetical protein